MLPVRTFVAIDMSPSVNRALASLLEQIQSSGAKAQWIRPENVHLTLSFLGDVDPLHIMDVCSAVSAAASEHDAFQLTCRGLGAFPEIGRPRVVWVGMDEGRGALCSLQAAIATNLDEIGYPKESRRYQPHITLGRVQRSADEHALSQIIEQFSQCEVGETRVDEVLVMSSQLERGGPRYAILGRAPLC